MKCMGLYSSIIVVIVECAGSDYILSGIGTKAASKPLQENNMMDMQRDCRVSHFEGKAMRNCYEQSQTETFRQLKLEAIGSKCDRGNPATVGRYLNLEPSLAMDWLEIAWDELDIKERIGAGTFSFQER